jgi:hypothetical protein
MIIMELSGKKILFIGPKFYGYHTSIIQSLESYGASVTFLPEMDYSVKFRILSKLFPSKSLSLVATHQSKLVDRTKCVDFDMVFVIRGGFFSRCLVESLKSALPKSMFVLYQWDSLKQNDYSNLIGMFDKVMTFDSLDAAKLNIPYEPLFYTSEYSNLLNERSEPPKYDLAFVGAYHSDRLEVVKKVAAFCDREGLAFRFHLFIKRLPLMRMLLTGRLKVADLRYLSTKSLSLPEVLDIYRESRAVLDIELNIQSGLSIRTFEALGADLNLVTTNKHVMSEPFYDPKRILVIDRDKVDLNVAFFTDKTVKKPYNDIDRYSLDKWLCRIFE